MPGQQTVECKVSMQRSMILLYTGKEYCNNGIQITILFTVLAKGIKYLLINLTKEAQSLYSEKYRTLVKEIQEDYIERRLLFMV